MVYFDAAYRRGLPLLIGHRGGGGKRVPENTVPAFAFGVAAGATVIETDVWLTVDEKVVTVHDPDLQRISDRDDVVSRVAYAEISRISLRDASGRCHPGVGVPLLEEVLDSFPEVGVNIDLKNPDPRLAERTVRAIRRCNATNRVCLASFSPAALAYARQIAPEIASSMDPREVRRFLLPFSDRDRCPVAIQVPSHYGPVPIVRPRFIRRAHKDGYEVHVWTINDPDAARRFARIGVDGIITDDVAGIIRAVDDGKGKR